MNVETDHALLVCKPDTDISLFFKDQQQMAEMKDSEELVHTPPEQTEVNILRNYFTF